MPMDVIEPRLDAGLRTEDTVSAPSSNVEAVRRRRAAFALRPLFSLSCSPVRPGRPSSKRDVPVPPRHRDLAGVVPGHGVPAVGEPRAAAGDLGDRHRPPPPSDAPRQATHRSGGRGTMPLDCLGNRQPAGLRSRVTLLATTRWPQRGGSLVNPRWHLPAEQPGRLNPPPTGDVGVHEAWSARWWVFSADSEHGMLRGRRRRRRSRSLRVDLPTARDFRHVPETRTIDRRASPTRRGSWAPMSPTCTALGVPPPVAETSGSGHRRRGGRKGDAAWPDNSTGPIPPPPLRLWRPPARGAAGGLGHPVGRARLCAGSPWTLLGGMARGDFPSRLRAQRGRTLIHRVRPTRRAGRLSLTG
jgi:hypothetical protein